MYLRDLLGIPYKIHGRRIEEGFDCYGLAIEVLKRFGIILPDYLYDATGKEEKDRVYSLAVKGIPHIELKNPEIGCIVLLEVHGESWHVGVYLGEGRFIHATRDSGVTVDNLRRWENRVKGYYKINN